MSEKNSLIDTIRNRASGQLQMDRYVTTCPECGFEEEATAWELYAGNWFTCSKCGHGCELVKVAVRKWGDFGEDQT